ncbi:Conserved_hypothetical protein [Hexamita inflata]|uniref:Uncharacterized protein n=1 Tax=Hexamita inflata TaxID=28002 RepID=A0AA86QTE0_9EUKA|nr:Conserved hypothetical protein [Hexamita inflata]CAI9957645.1 Conserved hypothetical protein [Hexamita inflata]CAI9963698.1 Conserved hypothetical protein [Hexamita inflata]CAI9964570.1 Conserved hypothetical protein [Hexamita inflata]
MELEIWRKRVETEIELCNKAWQKFDRLTNEMQDLEVSLFENSEDAALNKKYAEIVQLRTQALTTAQRLTMVTENLLSDYDALIVKSESHAQTMKTIQQLDTYHPILSEKEQEALKPIRYSTKTYADFTKLFEANLKLHKEEYDMIMRKHTVKKPAQPKYEPNVHMRPRVEPAPEIPDSEKERFRALILKNVKLNQTTNQNVYKDYREKVENAKIEKILKMREQSLNESKEEAKKLAQELAERDFAFKNELARAKKEEIEGRIKNKGFESNQKFVERVTKQDFTKTTANQYLPYYQQHFPSQQAECVNLKFGLGLADEKTTLRILGMDKTQILEQTKQRSEPPTDQLLELGINLPKTVKPESKSRPASQPAGKQEKKDSKKDPKKIVERPASESEEEPEPVLDIQYNKIEKPKKHIPIMHSAPSPKVQTFKGVSQILKKTQLVDTIQIINGKEIIVEKEVEAREVSESSTPLEEKEVIDYTSKKQSVRDTMKSDFKPTRDWNKQDQFTVSKKMPENTQKILIDSREAFVSQPDTLNFYNFKQFENQTQIFYVTNNSSTLQSFKVMPLEEKYKQMFELQFTPPGMMAPGQSLKISIQFNYNDPNIYEIRDVQTSLQIRYNGGEFSIPIFCYQQTPKIQVSDNEKYIVEAFQKLTTNDKLNNQLQDDQISKLLQFESGTLLNGTTQKQIYLLNSGLIDQVCRFRIDRIDVNQTAAVMLPESELKNIEKSISEYDIKKLDLTKSIETEYEQYQQYQQAIQQAADKKDKKGVKPQNFNHPFTPELNLQEYISSVILKQIGEKQAPIDENIRTFKKLIDYQNGESNLLMISAPQMIFYQGQKFEESKLKESAISQQKEKYLIQAKEDAIKEVTLIRDNELNQKVKGSKKATSIYSDQSEFDKKVIEVQNQLYDKLTENIENTINIQQQILQFEKQDETTTIFTIPAKSLIKIGYTHKPADDSVKTLKIEQQLQLLNKRKDVTSTYSIQSNHITHVSPVYLANNSLDMETCFYNSQYNQPFEIQMRIGEQNVTRQVKINVPKCLSDVVKLDQNNMVMNFKQNVYHPKVSIIFKNKLQLINLRNQLHEEWSQFSLSEVDQFFDSVVELGQDIKAKNEQIKEIRDKLDKQQTELTGNEQQKQLIQNKINETEQLLAQPVGKGQKPPKITVSLDDLKKQLDEMSVKISNNLQIIADLKELLSDIVFSLESEVSVGSYLELSFNLQLIVTQQPEILYLPIKSRWTVNELSIDLPSQMQLKEILTRHQSCVPVYIQNKSALAQHVGVLVQDNPCMRKDIQIGITPNGGVDLLFPGETRLFQIILKPQHPATYKLNVSFKGEFGYQYNSLLSFKSIQQQLQIYNHVQRIPEISLNDEYKTTFQMHNTSDVDMNFTVCQSFLDFSNSMQNMFTFAPCCQLLKQKQKTDVQLKIDINGKNALPLFKYLDAQSYDYSTFSFIRRTLPRVETPLMEYLQLQVPFMTSTGEFAIYSTQFQLRGPLVQVKELNKVVKVVRAESPVKADTKLKGKNQPVAVKVEPVIEEYSVGTSKITIDFGQCPLGSQTRKEAQLEFKNLICYVLEKSVPYYNADIEMKSMIHKKELKNYKNIIFEFVPRIVGQQQEIFEFEAYSDKECTEKKLNNIIITCIGEGVNANVNVDIQNMVSDWNQVGVEVKEKGKGPAVISNNSTDGILRHYIKPMNLNQTAVVQINLKPLSNFKFNCKIIDKNHSKQFKTYVYNQSVMLENDAQSCTIEILSLAETHQMEVLEFLVSAGNFQKTIYIHCFCAQKFKIFKHDDKMLCATVETTAVENGTAKTQIAAGKYEVLKSGLTKVSAGDLEVEILV